MTHDLTRRDVMKGAAGAAALAAASVPLQPAEAQGATVTGVVFEDRSGSGRRQPGDPGIAGVLVSNGREVTKTDASGRYTLPIDDETVIFVIKPTGYMVPVEPGTMLPRFYYIHQPKGTPADLNLRYRGIEPTGPLPASVDFALRKADERRAFDVLLFTDPQPESPVEVEFVRDDVVSALVGTKAAFGMTTGDLMFDDLSLYQRQNRIIGQIGVPWWNIPGNHDLNFEAPGTHYSRETFKRVFGPTSYAFEYGGALFLMLDNVEYLGTDPTRPRRDGKYQGHIGERQRAFIANVLAEQPADRLVVCAMHIPLRTYMNPDNWAVSTMDRGEFLKLIGERPCFSISGHTHTTEHHHFGAADGYAGATPHHHHVMTPCAARGGAGRSIIAASPAPTAATAAPTASTCSRSTATNTRRVSCRRRSAGRCASASTASSTATGASFIATCAWGRSSARRYRARACLRPSWWSTSSTAGLTPSSSTASAAATR